MEKLSFKRHRRLRSTATLRALISETNLTVDDLVYPLFIIEGEQIKHEVPSMPGVFQLSLDYLAPEIAELTKLGIKAVMLFGIPKEKDQEGSGAYSDQGIVQRAIRKIKDLSPELLVIADTCLCEYTSHGHCGIVEESRIINDQSLILHAKTAVSQANAGADIIAPSNMMDGFVVTIRKALDDAGFQQIPIMSYAIKYASAFYGPFRDAADSTPKFGDRKSYQMSPTNRLEAIREAASDIDEGADLLIIKPALAYLDIMREVREKFNVPLIAYNVSGEYAMVKAAAINGWIDEQAIVIEKTLAMKRAGADLIITYFAKDLAKWLNN